MDIQTNLFPMGGETMAHRDDPETSREAAQHMHRSGKLGRMQQIALDLVRRYPGLTAQEYDAHHGGGHVAIARRLSELKRKNLIYRSGYREIGGRRYVRWWPV